MAMKLSEAMRLGAMLKPQARYRLYDAVSGGTCALGAVADALGALSLATATYTTDARAKIPREWLSLKGQTKCPHCSVHIGTQIDHVIIHLNNEAGWTRWQIADWIETLESALSVGAVGQSVENPT